MNPTEILSPISQMSEYYKGFASRHLPGVIT